MKRIENQISHNMMIVILFILAIAMIVFLSKKVKEGFLRYAPYFNPWYRRYSGYSPYYYGRGYPYYRSSYYWWPYYGRSYSRGYGRSYGYGRPYSRGYGRSYGGRSYGYY